MALGRIDIITISSHVMHDGVCPFIYLLIYIFFGVSQSFISVSLDMLLILCFIFFPLGPLYFKMLL